MAEWGCGMVFEDIGLVDMGGESCSAAIMARPR